MSSQVQDTPQDASPSTGRRRGGAIIAVSSALIRFEMVVVTALMAMLALLVLLNVVTRYAGRPIYWVDEACVYAIVWLTFIGASAMTRLRLDFAVGMLTEKLSPAAQARCRIAATLAVIIFALLLGWMCWLWLDPAGFIAAGFDARELSGRTFNFVYTERTQTLGWPNWVFYLIMPIFAASLLVHATANLIEDVGWHPRVALPSLAGNLDATGTQTGALN